MRPARLLLAGLVGVALQLATGVAGAPSASAAACGPAPAGKVAVMVVIDVGEDSGAPWQRCVTVVDKATGLDVLRAAGVNLRIGPGGFVCGIGGTPASGCATDDPSLPGWAYWHASPGGSWTYSQVGGGGYRVRSPCAIEGWSFGPPSPKRPPRVAPPSVTCEAPAPTPTAPAATAPAAGGGGSAGAAGGGSGGAVTGGGTSGGGGAPRAEQPSEVSTSTTAPGEESPPDPEQPGSDGAPDASTEEETEDATADGERATARSEEPAQLEMADGTGGGGGGGSWVATAVVLLVVAAIGGGAVLRGRRR